MAARCRHDCFSMYTRRFIYHVDAVDQDGGHEHDGNSLKQGEFMCSKPKQDGNANRSDRQDADDRNDREANRTERMMTARMRVLAAMTRNHLEMTLKVLTFSQVTSATRILRLTTRSACRSTADKAISPDASRRSKQKDDSSRPCKQIFKAK